MLENVRPEIQQYFVESNTNGMPVAGEFRSLIYQRAKGACDTRPFGTIFDVFALGCIQSRSCHNDLCPTGVATQNPSRYQNLDVEGKSKRVFNYQRETVGNLVELLGAAGLENLSQLGPEHINRRVSGTVVKTYKQLYPHITPNCLLQADGIPKDWEEHWTLASAEQW